ncbi:MAG TPA: hypothetical protein VI893_00895, partial [Thermoplasmata archaeon]|nr:hypothetical protein [Thermoplasmata archaeon]
KAEYNRLGLRAIPLIGSGLLLSFFGFLFGVFNISFDIIVLPMFGVFSCLAGAILGDAHRKNEAMSDRTLALAAGTEKSL